MKPLQTNDVIRFKFLERPMRYYLNLSFHWKALIKTSILSFLIVIPPYNLVYMLKYSHSKAEILAKQDPGFTTDNLKVKIKDYKKRKEEGKVESLKEGLSTK